MTAINAHALDLEWYQEVPRSVRRQAAFGLGLILLAFGGFGIWASTAPLAAAVISQGTFVATGQNKIIQHLEGGIIQDVAVREGDIVKTGQILVRLDETASLANERQLLLRELRLEAILSRLGDEASNARTFSEPENDPAAMDEETRQIYAGQRAHFIAWRDKLDNDLQLLAHNTDALKARRNGEESQLASMEQQRELLLFELKSRTTLLEKGLVTRSEVMELQRAVADADGDIARLRAEVEEIDAQLAKYAGEMVQTQDAARQAALNEIQSAEIELDSVREQIRHARDVLERTEVRSPVDGKVVRIYYHTSGGVVESGKPIMEILPSGVPLLIETMISRNQIDDVRQGEPVAVRLIALSQRTTPVLTGRLDYLSPDSISDGAPAGAPEVYLARVTIPPGEIAKVPGFVPTPGMPAEVMVQTAQRTFLEYLAKPISDSMTRAFREN
ncbi:HlyD family type I secretion periplasmic adaptor subunit [Devosia sp. PTR5]|uniref:Membrane fusion protein (MFP) family protein n=1 Tax=Devosia oryzisoli TaxID=2774138 RepID=A0A927FWZ1_9HYPH|nr:HlyD family type I secretion periplasmic adaptor subunit [Devosia oryzisoli]MBD8066807.1 HlyD family type I secretion periplasmic adaptor subunit [Devosia oryzisoli]